METVVRVAQWLHLQIVWWATKRRYKVIPEPGEWFITMGRNPSQTVELLFSRGNVDQYSKLNMVIVVDDVFVIMGADQMFMRPAFDERVKRRFIEQMAPEWKVTVRLDTTVSGDRVRGELLSCVTLVKRLLGVQADSVQTTEQLLTYLAGWNDGY